MSQHDDRAPLQHMLEYAQTARRLVKGRKRADLDTDEMLRLALTRAVEVIGEAARALVEQAICQIDELRSAAGKRTHGGSVAFSE